MTTSQSSKTVSRICWRAKDKASANKILKKLLAEQAANINFLSDQLVSTLDQSDTDQSSERSSSDQNGDDSDRDEAIYHALGKRARAAQRSHSKTNPEPSLANAIQDDSSEELDFL